MATDICRQQPSIGEVTGLCDTKRIIVPSKLQRIKHK